MIGQTIEARPPFSIAIPFFILCALGLLGWSAAAINPHPLLAAILPLSLAFGLWFGRPSHVVLLVENDGLRPFGTHDNIRFSGIAYVSVAGREYDGSAAIPAAPIEIQHEGGYIAVPPRMIVDATEFYRFLVAWLPAPQPAQPHPLLADYFSEQTAKFGPHKVRAIGTRRAILDRWRRRRWRSICGALFVTGVIWLVAGIALSTAKNDDAYAPWAGIGSLVALISGLAFFVQSSVGESRNRQIAKFADSFIIVGPAGLAMVQGDIKGAMRWDEIVKVTSRAAQSFRASNAHGLKLNVRGGEVIAFDIYEHSPAELEQLIRTFLHGPAA
jgi:multidrug transporter EmrE-like cation transporter